MVNETGVPLQVLDCGVTVIIPLIGTNTVLVAVNAAILPVEEAIRPMLVFVFVQL